MAIPGYRIPWYRNVSIGKLAADVVLVAVATVTTSTAFVARSGSLYWSDFVLIALAFAAGIFKAWIAVSAGATARKHQGLKGCLLMLKQALVASAENGADPQLRLTVHVPTADGNQLEQVVDYECDEAARRNGGGRKFSSRCGIVGRAYRTRQTQVGHREEENGEAYIQQLVDGWNYKEDEARALDTRPWSYIAVPLDGDGGIEAILYIDSPKRDYFTSNRKQLVEASCVGLALFIGREYNKRTGD